ncbi:hypothetical protein P5V15_015285 [Pogonomyrmex californicus]
MGTEILQNFLDVVEEEEERRRVVEEEEEEERDDPAVCSLQPAPVALDYATGFDVETTSDVDSLLICALTPLPFLNDTGFTVSLRREAIQVSQNEKLISYLRRRDSLGKQQNRPLSSRPNNRFVREDTAYEFVVGHFGGDSLFVLFQIKRTAAVLASAPPTTTKYNEGRLLIARKLFLREVVARAARRMPPQSVTAMSGLGWVQERCDGAFHVPSNEWPIYAAHVGEILEEISLKRECGIQWLRFYRCHHGIRAPADAALRLLSTTCNESHPDVDVIQIHRADVLRAPDGDALVVKLDGHGPGTLSVTLSGPIRYPGGKSERYRVGFLSNFGYFRKYCSLQHDSRVTYVQAYNPAAKSARPAQMSLLAIAVLCRFFEGGREARAQSVAAAALQNTRNLITYASRYTRDMPGLRIEEVAILDSRVVKAMPTAIGEVVGAECSTTGALLAVWCTASPIGRDIATTRSGRTSHFCVILLKRTTSARCRRSMMSRL